MAKSTHPTLREIRDTHAWKREYEKFLPLSRYVFRPLGFLATWLAIRVGLASEMVSWISGFVALIGCLCLMSSQEQLLLIGISLLIFFNLLDCVDGSIARTMKTENPYGSFLDSAMAWMDMGLWALIGFMAYRHPQLLLWPDPFDKGEIVWLITGGITCYFYNLVSYIEGTFDRLLREGINKLNKSESEIPTGNVTQNRTPTLFFVKTIILRINHNLRVRETYLFLLVLAFFGRTIDLLLIFFLFYFVLHIILLVFIYCCRGRQLRKSHLQELL